jgi:hypothetical protein
LPPFEVPPIAFYGLLDFYYIKSWYRSYDDPVALPVFIMRPFFYEEVL